MGEILSLLLDLSKSVLLKSEESYDYFSGTLDGLGAGHLAYLSSLGNFLISVTTSLSSLVTFLIYGKTFWGVVEISGVTLFDYLYREELQYMPGDEKLMSLGVEYLGVLGVFGVTSVVALGVLGFVTLGVTGNFSLWFTGKVVF